MTTIVLTMQIPCVRSHKLQTQRLDAQPQSQHSLTSAEKADDHASAPVIDGVVVDVNTHNSVVLNEGCSLLSVIFGSTRVLGASTDQ